MKSCPLCSETYSERIDFCFNDGGVLQLLPSALDAPVPRRLAALDPPTAGRLRTVAGAERHAELPVIPDPVVASDPIPPAGPAAPFEATDAPEPSLAASEAAAPVDEDETQLDLPRLAAAPTPRPAGPTPSPTPSVPPVFDDLAREVGPQRERRPVPALLWFAATAAVAGAAVVLLFAIASGTPPEPPPRPAAHATPSRAPVAPVAAPPVEAVAVAVTSDPPAPSPSPAPSPVSADKPSAAPVPAPTSRVQRDRTEPHITRVSKPIVAPAGPSPWDAPVAAAEGVVQLTSDPSGAIVRIDGKLRGKTPVDVKVPFGRHKVELQLEGYALVQRTIDVRTASVKVPNQLDPASLAGTVEVLVPDDWNGASLSIDGRPRGKVPARLELTEGAHRFEVRRGDFRAVDERIVRFDKSSSARLMLDPR